MEKQFRGIFATPQTPFNNGGYIDKGDLRKEVDFCIRSGVHGIAALVLSAEFFTLSDDERKKVAEIIIEETDHRVPVAICSSGVSTQVAVMFAKHANEKGADAVIAIPPYTMKDNLDGIYQYYKAISDNINIPIILQNAPPPLGSSLSPFFIKRLVEEIEHIQYVKEENMPAPHFLSSVFNMVGDIVKGVFGGMGGRWLITEFKRGACGWIVACEFSDVLVEIYEELSKGNEEYARTLLDPLIPLIDMELLYWENFTKEVLKRRGIIKSTYTRIPDGRRLDLHDMEELEFLLKKVQPFYKL